MERFVTERDKVVPAVAAVRAAHPAARVAVRGAEKSEQHVTRLAEPASNAWTVPVFQRVMLVNSAWTVLVKSCLVQSLLVRIHNNRPERMNAGVSSAVKINVRTFHAELVKSPIMKPVPVMLIRLVLVKKEAEKRFTT